MDDFPDYFLNNSQVKRGANLKSEYELRDPCSDGNTAEHEQADIINSLDLVDFGERRKGFRK